MVNSKNAKCKGFNARFFRFEGVYGFIIRDGVSREMGEDMCVVVWAYKRSWVRIPIRVWENEVCDVVWVSFGGQACLVDGLMCHFNIIGVGIADSVPFVLKCGGYCAK